MEIATLGHAPSSTKRSPTTRTRRCALCDGNRRRARPCGPHRYRMAPDRRLGTGSYGEVTLAMRARGGMRLGMGAMVRQLRSVVRDNRSGRRSATDHCVAIYASYNHGRTPRDCWRGHGSCAAGAAAQTSLGLIPHNGGGFSPRVLSGTEVGHRAPAGMNFSHPTRRNCRCGSQACGHGARR